MSRIPLILGAGMWGYPETQSRIQDLETAQRMIDVMLSHHYIGIDSAQNYGEGTSEKMLGALDLRGQARVDTKIFPLHPEDFKSFKVKEAIKKSLVDLGPHKIRVFYLHNPDRATPFEETLGAINDLYKQGIFEEFGLSNFMSWEVAEVVGICERRGFIKPTVYQGIYNLLDRTPEGELFPCLRKFGIRFAAYSTLAGGYLTGKHLDPSIEAKAVAIEDKNSHYNPEWPQSWFYLTRYPPMAAAVSKLKAVSDKHEIALAEVAYRWLQWHSAMIPADQGVILGASRVEQLEAAILSSSKGPLPEEVVKACEQAWIEVRGVAKNYWLESSIVQIISDTH